jgi:DNA-binding Lrp family transcriptional regulator
MPENNLRLLQTPPLSTLQQALLDGFQQDFPLSPRPYADIAAQLGVSEEEVLAELAELNKNKVISRIGPVFKPHRIGTSTLAAMAVPPPRLAETAALVSGLAEVNHNYEREHPFNLWFVLTATDEQHLDHTLHEIERLTGLPVMSLPMLEEFHIDLGFRLNHSC